jgi:hypothetical protein
MCAEYVHLFANVNQSGPSVNQFSSDITQLFQSYLEIGEAQQSISQRWPLLPVEEVAVRCVAHQPTTRWGFPKIV